MPDSTTQAADHRREEVRKVLLRHHGASAQIARDLGIAAVNVSQYLAGKGRSKRVAAACARRAAELLIDEGIAEHDETTMHEKRNNG